MYISFLSLPTSNSLCQVLTIGATNLASELDGALLRPGRFEVTYEISAPSPIGRLEILKYHSRNKPLANQDMLLKVAEVTVVSYGRDWAVGHWLTNDGWRLLL